MFLDFKVYLPISCFSVLLCLTAVGLVWRQKLHKILVYRLAMYQVLSAMEFSIMWIVSSMYIFLNLTYEVTMTLAKVLPVLLMGSSFIKLMFAVWISIHLFALAVFHKNLQRLERLYVVSSLLIPVVVTVVLLCINFFTCGYVTQVHEEYVYVIVFAVLVLISLLMVVMGTILCHRACRSRNAILSEYDKQHKKALCEMLPLLLYPILFLVFTIPVFKFTIDDFVTQIPFSSQAPVWFGIMAPCWSFTTSLLLISHLCIVKHIKLKKELQNKRSTLRRTIEQWNTDGTITITETTPLCQNSNTHYSAPIEE